MENRVMQLNIGERVFRRGAVLAALIACVSIEAADQTPGSSATRTDTTTPSPATRTDSTTGNPTTRADTTTTTSSTRTETSTGSLSRADANFVKEAAKGNQMEIKLGQLGKDQGQNPEVKKFGERMVKDHTDADAELMKVAQTKGVDLAAEQASEADHMTREVKKFSSKTGADFDRAYVKHMVTDHKKDISKFEKEAAQGTDADVKAFAQKTLPTLREHLRLAEDLARTVGVSTASYTTSTDESAAGASGTVSTERGTSYPNTDKTKSGIDRSSQGSISTSDRDASASAQVETKPKTKWFSTDKSDGKLWGIFPAPHHKNRETGVDMSADISTNRESAVGSAPSTSSGSSTDNTQK